MKSRKFSGLVLAFALGLFMSTSATAFYEGKVLVDAWREYKKASLGLSHISVSNGFYIGFVAGVAIENIYQSFFPPDGTSVEQYATIVGNWIEKNPQKWNLGPQFIVEFALMEAFPLPEKLLKRKNDKLIGNKSPNKANSSDR